ncbi:hypothetical protein [Bradyrhizobium sp. Gha]|uniref:hypothetical protein n=1 Tax=Bradyrhizobium sp. Gha TaxID=1855318 RepID=UPI0011603F15|nr:hypothetical protein [Bradyrhizobium sp. Gha]
MIAKRRSQAPPLFVLGDALAFTQSERHTRAVIARLDRAIQHSEAPAIEPKSLGLLDAPLSRRMTPIMLEAPRKQRNSSRVPYRYGAQDLVSKSSFTIRVDQMFTASDDAAFTNVQHRPLKTPDIA